ncbi:unnamed protein product [Cylindrotheca closterium]|uniref:Uncharacterized protein n=1 Tax=Cylindrotheca closterium TaxID=2856 RepID=A0AAD2FDK8_9STRA|nr:unnamed protein product [Cylindrotheca closterium]
MMLQKQSDKSFVLPEAGTESTDSSSDVSFQSASLRTADCDESSPTLSPLKHCVTIGSTDSKDILSLMNRRNGNPRDNVFTTSSRKLSDRRVSEMFLKERRMSLYDSYARSSSKSFFVDDLQTLFDAPEEEEDATSSSTPSSVISINKTCTFGGVEIREYPIIAGDSPAGFKGPPLAIGWTPVSTVRFPNVEKYESVRSRHRRTAKDLTIPASQRMVILTNQGFARSEIQKCTKDANLARRQRKETMATLKYQATFEKIESVKRKTLNVVTFGQRNKAQKEYLEKYVPNYGVAPTPVA